jgi:hypothetical protein
MHNIRTLLLVTLVVEALAGAALLVAPAPSTALLLGVADTAPAPFVMQRLCGAALLSIALACWIAYSEGGERLGRPLIAGLLIYNVAVPAVLAYAAFAYSVSSLAIWPACALHVGLAVWGVACLRV